MIALPRFIRLKHISIICCVAFGLVAQYAIAIVDSDQPVYITADNANFDNIKGIAEYEGNVVVNQGSRHLEANKLTIQRDADNQIKVMTAIGDPANFKSQPDADKPVGYGSAKIIKYYPQQNKVDLLENAKLMQNGDTLSGPKLSYNFVTEVLQGKSSKQQRTTVILQPKRAKQ